MSNRTKISIYITALIITLSLGSSNSYAQEKSEDQQKSEAITILKSFSTKFKSYSGVKATFAFSISNIEADLYEEFTGKIAMCKKKYRVTVEEQQTTIYNDGESIYTYMEDAEEVQITSVEENSTDLLNPANLFNISEADLDVTYKVSQTTTDSTEGLKVNLVSIFPNNPEEREFSQLDMYITATKNHLIMAKIHGTDGNLYTVNIANFQGDITYSDDQFSFNRERYPDVEIIDMR